MSTTITPQPGQAEPVTETVYVTRIPDSAAPTDRDLDTIVKARLLEETIYTAGYTRWQITFDENASIIVYADDIQGIATFLLSLPRDPRVSP